MRRAATVLLVLALAAGLFAGWGLFTPAGTQRFDEMAGIVPFFAGIASGALLAAAALARLVSARADGSLARRHRAAVLAALHSDDRPLRAAYARVAHTTVADLRDRLAEPGDHDRRAWPTFADYRAMVLRAQRRGRPGVRQPQWQRPGDPLERGWRFAGLDFAEVITRERAGRIDEVEFVGAGDPPVRHVVRLG